MILKKERFEEAYQKLAEKACKNGDENPSFNSGYWAEQEHYKYDFWEDAREKMKLDTWPECRNDLKIFLNLASQPFGIMMSDADRLQNLVSSPNYDKVLLHIFSGSEKIRKEAADVLYGLYYGDNDEDSFKQLAKLMKGLPDPISVVSTYFFLKDKVDGDFCYVTARKEGTSERLGKLGLHTSCLQKCTWEGYQEFLDLIKQIQEYLRPHHPDATLLDAQSFLWMMHMIK